MPRPTLTQNWPELRFQLGSPVKAVHVADGGVGWMLTPLSLTSRPIQSLASPPVTWVSPDTVIRNVSVPRGRPTTVRVAAGQRAVLVRDGGARRT